MTTHNFLMCFRVGGWRFQFFNACLSWKHFVYSRMTQKTCSNMFTHNFWCVLVLVDRVSNSLMLACHGNISFTAEEQTVWLRKHVQTCSNMSRNVQKCSKMFNIKLISVLYIHFINLLESTVGMETIRLRSNSNQMNKKTCSKNPNITKNISYFLWICPKIY